MDPDMRRTVQQTQIVMPLGEVLTDQDILDTVETTNHNSESHTDTVVKFLEHEKQTTQHSKCQSKEAESNFHKNLNNDITKVNSFLKHKKMK